MIDGLLNYSKIQNESLKLIKINLETVIHTTLSSLQISIEEKNAEIILPDEFPIVDGHPTLLGQVFLNLINNSLKFTEKNVTPVINISWNNYNEDFVLVNISDNGIGIEEKYHKEVFGIFGKRI